MDQQRRKKAKSKEPLSMNHSKKTLNTNTVI